MHILIAGAGIAGLSAAAALRHHGIEVTVLEQARQIGEIGAGIQIASNGTVVMRELGLEPQMRDVAVFPQEYDYRDMMSGRKLYEASLGEEAVARYGAPLYHIHRADLIDMLIGTPPPAALRLNAKVTEISQNAGGVEVVTAAGERFAGDALIGADGIHSAVRGHMFGADEPLFTGILMWRSLIPAERLKDVWLPERGNYWFGPGRTLVTYWVRPQELYSVVASVPADEIHRESWSESGDVTELHDSFRDVEPRALAVVSQIDKAYITGMYHREPAAHWGEGRVSLIGDAAHPMVPFLAQGACQGIEDAWTLARVLHRRGDDVVAALREYEERRRPRTTRMQAAALAIVKLLHEPDPDRVRARNGRWKGMSRIDPLAETSWKFAWGYDVLDSTEKAPGEVMGLTGLREGKRMARPESQRAFDLWKGCFTPADVAGGHDGMRLAYDRFLTGQFPPPADARIEAAEPGGVPALRVTPAGQDAPNEPDTGPVVLHFHGGGYMIGSAQGSLEYAHRLAQAVGGTCVTVDYRLAPEHPYPAALDDAADAYRGLLKEGVAPARILLSGESSGGGLAVALALLLRTAGDPLPAGIVAASPFTDLSLSGESIDAYSGDDPAANRDSLSFMAASYFQGHEPTDPYVSPVFGELAGLPPLFVTAVRDEVLASDATRLIERAQAAGVAVRDMLVEDSVHVFPVFPFLPETQAAMTAIGDWSREILR